MSLLKDSALRVRRQVKDWMLSRAVEGLVWWSRTWAKMVAKRESRRERAASISWGDFGVETGGR